MYTIIIVTFVVGYLFIAMEGTTRINKSGIALLMSVLCWTFFVVSSDGNGQVFLGHVEETCETILFLMGAMTIVEVLDRNGCFNFLVAKLNTDSLRTLLWKTALLTFFLSAVLDNMTTAILMIMMLRKLVQDKGQRLFFAGTIIIAANAGGAFSPIGDVTTIMLWINGNVTASGILTKLFLPSLASVLIPLLLLTPMVKGSVELPSAELSSHQYWLSRKSRTILLCIGVIGLISVPIYRACTNLPPFVGIMGVLALLWIASEIMLRFDNHSDTPTQDVRVAEIIKRIDIPTILFFLGILLSVGALKEIGALASLGAWLDESVGNVYAVNGMIGILSSVVDNVPLVAASMSMYSIEPAGVADAMQIYQQDGAFWQLLAYCAGTGGSLLIIGSAAGVVVMGLENISFGWYLKRISLLALAGYLAGLFVFFFSNLCHF